MASTEFTRKLYTGGDFAVCIASATQGFVPLEAGELGISAAAPEVTRGWGCCTAKPRIFCNSDKSPVISNNKCDSVSYCSLCPNSIHKE